MRSNNQEWFYIPPIDCWTVFQSALRRALERYGGELHAMVLMSNHLHLILVTPQRNIDEIMRHCLSIATRSIQRRAGRKNHVLGARYRWTVLDSAYSLAYVLKYVYRNPVRAGICTRVEDYPFSTINVTAAGLPLCEGFDAYWRFVPRDFTERLTWLNRPTPREAEELIKRALRRYHFQFPKGANAQKALRELRRTYAVEPDLS